MNVIVAGSGFIGNHLRNQLSKNGHTVTMLSRKAKVFPRTITWSEIKSNGLPECDAVVNLCGENAFKPFLIKPYNDKYKKDIIDSRIGCNKLINDALSSMKEGKPKVFVSASAVGIYGTAIKGTYSEESQLPSDMCDNFMVQMVKDWEASSEAVGTENDCRVVSLRIGLVLGTDGGMLQQVKWQYYFGFGGQLSDGTHPFPWIHIDDTVRAIEHVINTPSIQGPVNLVAPGSVNDTASAFNTTLAKVMNRRAYFKTPKLAFDIMFGKDRSDLMFSKSAIEPKILNESKFEFKYPELEVCLKNLVG